MKSILVAIGLLTSLTSFAEITRTEVANDIGNALFQRDFIAGETASKTLVGKNGLCEVQFEQTILGDGSTSIFMIKGVNSEKSIELQPFNLFGIEVLDHNEESFVTFESQYDCRKGLFSSSCATLTSTVRVERKFDGTLKSIELSTKSSRLLIPSESLTCKF